MKKIKGGASSAFKKDGTSTAMLVHELEDLLQTVRWIARHEDELCTLTETARKSHDDELLEDLRGLLEKMSEVDYRKEVSSVILRLPRPLGEKAPQKKPSKKSKGK